MESKRMENAIKEARNYYGARNGYDMSYLECFELVETATDNPIKAVTNAFDYGFIKGIRFAKSKEKKGVRS